MKYNGIIFDMDGVIFDTERVYLRDWKKVFNEFNYTIEDEVYISLMGRGRKVVKEVFRKTYGEDLPIDEMYILKDKLLQQAIESNSIPLKEGVIEILDYLKENNFKIALATSAKRDRALKQLKGANILEYFHVIVTGDDIVNAKPNAEIYLKAASLLNIPPDECILIEDSLAGIRGGNSAKMLTLHVEDLKKADEEILGLCHKSFVNMKDIKLYFTNKFS